MKNTKILFMITFLLLAFLSCQKEDVSQFQSDSELVELEDLNHLDTDLNAIKGKGQSSKKCIQVEDEGAASLGVHEFPNYPGSGIEIPDCSSGMICGWGALPFYTELAEGIEGYMASIVLAIRPTGNMYKGGATHYRLVHYFVDGDGDAFWTDDQAVCNPMTPNPGHAYDLDCIVNDQMTIVYGTGKFCNAYGKIFNHGVIDLAANEVVFKIKGRLCSDCMYE